MWIFSVINVLKIKKNTSIKYSLNQHLIKCNEMPLFDAYKLKMLHSKSFINAASFLCACQYS